MKLQIQIHPPPPYACMLLTLAEACCKKHVNRTIYIIETRRTIEIDIFSKDPFVIIVGEIITIRIIAICYIGSSSKEIAGSSPDSESASLPLSISFGNNFSPLYHSLCKVELLWTAAFPWTLSWPYLIIHIFEALVECERHNPIGMNPRPSKKKNVRCVSVKT